MFGQVGMSTTNKSITVGFFWQTQRSNNLGVGALALSNLALASKAAARCGLTLEPWIFCSSDQNQMLGQTHTSGHVGDAMSPKRMLLGKSQFIKQIKNCDVALDIGEGDSFSDIYGAKRLLLLCLSKFLLIYHRVPLVISPQTIGPFKAAWGGKLSNWLMRRATRVFARDNLSMNYLKNSDIVENSDEVIDVAFALPYDKIIQRDIEKVHVGLNVSGLLFHGGYTGDNQFGLKCDYASLVRKLLAHFCADPKVQVHLIGHVISDTFEVEDDYRVIQKMHKDFPSCVLAPKFSTPSQAKSYIAGLDFFTGARMHACIGAFSSGVPVVPMAYSRKFNGLFGTLNYRNLADLKAHDTDEAFMHIVNGFERRPDLAAQVAAGNLLAQQKLKKYEDYLVSLFGALAHG